MQAQSEKPIISVLVPLLNEEESLPELNERLCKSLEAVGRPFEIIYINDGSTDPARRWSSLSEGTTAG